MIISSNLYSFLMRYWSKCMSVFKKCLIFSVFCVFLNKEWSVSHDLYIFVNLSNVAAFLVKKAKWGTVFLTLWEFWPKKEICQKFIENTILLIEVVHTVVYNVEIIFSGSRIYFQIRKLIYFYSKNSQKIRKNRNK